MKKYLAILFALQLAWPVHAIERNQPGQYLELQVIDSATGAPKTGDSANLTAYRSIDGGTLTALTDTSATEMSSTNAPGVYRFDLSAAETNGINIAYTGKSSTSGVYVVPRLIAATPPEWSALTRQPRVWYVSSDTDGNGDTGDYGSPFDTFGDAQTAAKAGDTIYIVGTYASRINVTKSGLTITGSGSVDYSGSDAAHSGSIYVASGVNDVTIQNLTVKGTNATYGTAIRFGTTTDSSTWSTGNKVIGCVCEGRLDTLFFWRQQGLVVENCQAISKTAGYDGAYFSYCTGVVKNLYVSTDGTYSPYPTTGTRGIICGVDCRLQFVNVTAISTRAAASAYHCTAFETFEPTGVSISAAYSLEDCTLYAAAAHASDTGQVAGIGASNVAGPYSYNLTMRGGRIITSNAGSGGTAYDVHAPSGSNISFVGPVLADRTKLNASGATIKWLDRDPLQPTTSDRTLDVTATGEAGIDWANVGSPTTSVNLSGTTVSTSQQVASVTGSVGSVASATSIATELLATTNGSDTVASQLANLDAAVSSAVSAGTVAPYLVDSDHSWKFTNRSETTSPIIVQENIGFVGLIQMDFTEPIPVNGSIASITTTSVADVADATEPTISSSALSLDKRKVVLSVNCASATAATYTFSVKIVTTDSQTIIRKGRLTLQ